MGISIGEIRPSVTILYKDALYIVIDCTHVKVARGPASCRVKLRNLKTGQILECTLRDSDDVEFISIEKRKLQYSYNDGDFYHFMDRETYEDLILNKEQVGSNIAWLKNNLEINGLFYQNELIDLDFPATIELKVVKTEPGFKGDTAKPGTKPAKLETGVTINVPLFITESDIVRVDTKNKTYMSRV